MANNNRRRMHSSPGVYFSEAELTYSAKSLGITTLGVAGETLRGPAFQSIPVEDWRQYQTYFGGTSTEKFKGTQYPKYELPYIAKSYLEQSQQLEVVRVLGLSGVNAGPAWVITAEFVENGVSCDSGENGSGSGEEGKKYVVAVLRSRGEHKKSVFKSPADPEHGICEDKYEFDGIEYYADEVEMVPSSSLTLGNDCNPGFDQTTGCFNISSTDYGTFTLVVKKNGEEVNRFSVSLNAGAKNYMVSVLGTTAEKGDAEIYVEEMYDVALRQLIENGSVNVINKNIVKFPQVYMVPAYKPVNDLLTMDDSNLTRKNVGMRYLYQESEWNAVNTDMEDGSGSGSAEGAGDIIYDPESKTFVKPEEGKIYTVTYITINNRRKNVYVATEDKLNEVSATIEDGFEFVECVKCKGDGLMYVMSEGKVVPVTLDMNNYKEQYRYSSTPWVVSELKGSAENVELNKLFRFHTISDGNTSSTEIKVSIANIDPTYGTFDVLVRDFYDTDNSPVVYERFVKCTLVPGDQNYVALKIGSFDGTYSAVSKYITVEVNENDNTRMSIPAGFLGYPVRDFKNGIGIGVSEDALGLDVYMRFNQDVDEDIKPNRQYFGVSNRTGIDEDMFRYKGVNAYYGMPSSLTPCFHLDSRIINGTPDADGVITDEYNNEIKQTVSVDGVKGYSWVTVGQGNVTEMGIEPRIGTEDEMVGTIYENKAFRKFTMAFYGGWDGWDYYRASRSNTDEFTYSKYKGAINYDSGFGKMFNVISDPEEYELESTPKSLNSDYYAYLSAIRQLSNPKNIEINVLATPGIDYVNNLMLVEDVIEMVNDRADVLYVVTTPDKPSGAGDSVSEMYTPQDAVWNLEDTEIDTNRACTYYPWGKYFDADNSQYVFLPITRDVVKSIAYTDNIAFPWYGNAGWDRGNVSCVAPRKKLKVGEQDTLYDGRINFVNSFAKEGDRIWGDKNLQVEETQMNRISKRRLMLRIKKLCENACIGLLFNPNDAATAQSFRSAVTPILEKIKGDRGIVDFRIEVDDSVEARERLELPAVIYIKPTKLLEYIDIKAVVTAQGVSFE